MLVAEEDTDCSLEFCVCLTICSTLAVTTALSQLTMEYISWGRGAMTHTVVNSSAGPDISFLQRILDMRGAMTHTGLYSSAGPNIPFLQRILDMVT